MSFETQKLSRSKRMGQTNNLSIYLGFSWASRGGSIWIGFYSAAKNLLAASMRSTDNSSQGKNSGNMLKSHVIKCRCMRRILSSRYFIVHIYSKSLLGMATTGKDAFLLCFAVLINGSELFTHGSKIHQNAGVLEVKVSHLGKYSTVFAFSW